ncbi:hypothetical protein ACH4GP_36830 [Streptomyces celluloflavus]|uniref:AB hydrolase-1 domain-containing protein n=1 Tax=Streptomyces celluloflavus TaxID=58344 RepID=A0ABW7RP67_9ACTN
MLDSLPEPPTVLGHSYGGSVITRGARGETPGLSDALRAGCRRERGRTGWRVVAAAAAAPSRHSLFLGHWPRHGFLAPPQAL